MRIAYLDCFSGISGDMFLGALLDAGVPSQVFEHTVAALNVGAQLEISHVDRCGISACKLDVVVHGEKELPREVFWEQQNNRTHEHGHTHKQEHGDHGNHHGHHDRGIAGGRSFNEIKQIVSAAAIQPNAKATAIRVFEALGTAEAKVHNRNLETIHFHEVGTVDAIVDIVCAAVGAHELGVDKWVCSPLNVGGGTVKCAHGTFPIPAPATLELLKGAPVYSSGLNVELVTPTGAAIVTTLVNQFSSFPRMRVQKAGYGAGTREFRDHPNLLRLTIGDTEETVTIDVNQERISVLEANLDDLNPQVFGYVLDRLLEEGALDVFGAPVQMKKNRPGMLLTVLCRPENSSRLSQVIFTETTTLGIRRRDESRDVLSRKWISVETRWGSVRMKVAGTDGAVTNYAPEYEDCRRIAREHGVPLKSVMQEAIQRYAASNEFTIKHAKAQER